jgi:pimeloyl-ACP methyl ester carboxylesterase
LGAQGYDDFYYTSQDALKLYARIYGSPREGAQPVVCLAGLTRNSADFHDLALHLANDASAPRQVIAFDYRGRGRSTYAPDWKTYDPIVETGDVLAGMAALGIEDAAFIGTSRGGLIIMILAAMRPAVLKAAVLNDIGPVVQAEGLTAIRAYLERAPKPKTFAEAAELQRAIAGPETSLTTLDFERMARAIFRDENGMPVPDYDPALLETLKTVDLDKPLPELWPQFTGLANIPVMAIRGANSTLLSADTLAEMEKRHPGMISITVAGQGHAPLLETGDLPKRIAAFFKSAEKSASSNI